MYVTYVARLSEANTAVARGIIASKRACGPETVGSEVIRAYDDSSRKPHRDVEDTRRTAHGPLLAQPTKAGKHPILVSSST